MKKKNIIISVIVLAIIIAGGFLFWRNGQEKVEVAQGQPQEQQKFVVDVDSSADHWQTKETEFFTIKFPKEWYWLESDREKTGYRSHIITNNPDFDINKYADIGVFTGGSYLHAPVRNEDGRIATLQLSDAEVLISFNGKATSDSGTPQQSIESGLRGIKESHTQAKCEYASDEKNIPIVADCVFMDINHQKVQTYFIADEKNTIFFSVRTTKGNLMRKEILDKMARSMILKGPF